MTLASTSSSYPFPPEEFTARRERLQGQMGPADLDAVIIAQNAGLYYFTGTVQSGLLYVPREGEAVYCVRRDVERARRESPLEHVVPFRAMKEVPPILAQVGLAPARRIGYELDVLPVTFHERYRRTFSEAASADAAPLLRRVRMIKSELELAEMRRAADQIDRMLRVAQGVLREGMTELELAAELERASRLEGHPGIIPMRAFNGVMLYGHVLAGSDSAVPAYLDTPLGGAGPHRSFGQGAGHRRIKRHEPVIVDWGGSVNGYLADQTRVLCLGELPERWRRAYADMLRVQALMTEVARPGVPWGTVYERCLALAVDLGHVDNFMGAKGAQVSFIGHGLGLEIDEPPFLARGFQKEALEPGVVFAFEPKLVFPGEGAIGVENTWVLRENGPERITYSDEAVIEV